MRYTGTIIKQNNKQLLINLDDFINEDFKELISENKQLRVNVELRDNRTISVDQRKLIYSLIKDIANFTGYDAVEVKALVKFNFEAITGVEDISFSDCEKVQATEFIRYLIDLVLELNIPLKQRYQYLLTDNYFFYKCLKNRVCCICGRKHADIAHVETVGMGRDRRNIDHTKHSFMSLCRTHHTEQHTIGIDTFINKYQIIPVRLNDNDVVKLGLISNIRHENIKNNR